MPAPRISPLCTLKRMFHGTAYICRRSKGAEHGEEGRNTASKRTEGASKVGVNSTATASSTSDFRKVLAGLEDRQQSTDGTTRASDASSDRKPASGSKLSDLLLNLQQSSRSAGQPPRTVQAPKLVERIDRVVKQQEQHAKQTRETKKGAQAAGVPAASYAAVRNVAKALSEKADPIETSQIESDLLRKLRQHEEQTTHLKSAAASDAAAAEKAGSRMQSVFADMKYDKARPEAEPGAIPAEWLTRTIEKAAEGAAPSVWPDSGQQHPQQYQQQSMQRQQHQRYERESPPPRRGRQPRYMGEAVRLFEGPGLGVFGPKIDQLQDHNSVMLIWDKLHAERLQYKQSHTPRNAFQEMQKWTEQGRMWNFPIDNEQGLEPDGTFDEHIFLLPLIDDFPTRGPIYDFMEVVVYALSHNPYLSVKEKYDHVDWFRKYFKEKRELLVTALGEEMATFGEEPSEQDKPGLSKQEVEATEEKAKYTEVVWPWHGRNLIVKIGAEAEAKA